MFEELETPQSKNAIVIGEELSTLSVDDIDERVEQLEAEITRLKEERLRKTSIINQAEAFFKKPD